MSTTGRSRKQGDPHRRGFGIYVLLGTAIFVAAVVLMSRSSDKRDNDRGRTSTSEQRQVQSKSEEGSEAREAALGGGQNRAQRGGVMEGTLKAMDFGGRDTTAGAKGRYLLTGPDGTEYVLRFGSGCLMKDPDTDLTPCKVDKLKPGARYRIQGRIETTNVRRFANAPPLQRLVATGIERRE